jgi:ABC-type transporter Mla subunit MlaD
MTKQNRNIVFTTIAVENATDKLIEKLCKRYSLKKGEIVKLAFLYLDKAHINPADAPESVKTELAKINKRQDDIIRFIRRYEEEQLNPMIRTSHSIAVKFDTVAGTLSQKVDAEIKNSQENLINVLKKLDEQFGKVATVINNQAKQINNLSQVNQRENKKLLQLISLYSELATCGVMDGKRKENLRAEINDLINEK